MRCPDCGGKRRRLRRYNPDPYELSPEEIHMMRLQKQVEELARGGMGASNIAKQLGISERQVIKWIQHIIDERKTKRDQARQLARGLHKELGDATAVHKQFKKEGIEFSYGTVYRWVKNTLTKEEREQLRLQAERLAEGGLGARKIAKQLGVGRPQAIQWIQHIINEREVKRDQAKQRARELYPQSGNAHTVYKRLKEEGFKVSQTTVHEYVKYLSKDLLSPRRQELEQARQRAIELYPQLENARAVLKRLKKEGFKVTHQTVLRWVDELLAPRRQVRKKTKQRAQELYKQLRGYGAVYKRLKEEGFKVSRETVRAYIIGDRSGGKRRRLRRYNPDPYELRPEEIRMMRLRRKAERLAEEGIPYREIAKQLGISSSQVIDWIRHIFDERKAKRDQWVQRARELYETGLTAPDEHDPALVGDASAVHKQLAKEGIEIPYERIRHWVKDLPSPRKQKLAQAKQRAIELYPKLDILRTGPGLVHERLKEEDFEVSYETVSRWLKPLPSPKKQWEQRALYLYKTGLTAPGEHDPTLVGDTRAVQKQLAEEGLEVSYTVVRKWVSPHSKLRRQKIDQDKQRARELYPQLGTVIKVHTQLKEEGIEVPYQTLVGWVNPPRKQEGIYDPDTGEEYIWHGFDPTGGGSYQSTMPPSPPHRYNPRLKKVQRKKKPAALLGENLVLDAPLEDIKENIIVVGPFGQKMSFFGFDPGTHMIYFLIDSDDREFVIDNIKHGKKGFPIFMLRRGIGAPGTLDQFWKHKSPVTKKLAAAGQFIERPDKIIFTHIAMRRGWKRRKLGTIILNELKRRFPDKPVLFHDLTDQGRKFMEHHEGEEYL